MTDSSVDTITDLHANTIAPAIVIALLDKFSRRKWCNESCALVLSSLLSKRSRYRRKVFRYRIDFFEKSKFFFKSVSENRKDCCKNKAARVFFANAWPHQSVRPIHVRLLRNLVVTPNYFFFSFSFFTSTALFWREEARNWFAPGTFAENLHLPTPLDKYAAAPRLFPAGKYSR